MRPPAREIDALRLPAKGCSDQAFADALFISRATARTRVRNVLAKLGVGSRAAALACAFQHGPI